MKIQLDQPNSKEALNVVSARFCVEILSMEDFGGIGPDQSFGKFSGSKDLAV
jgi:hypothetical protein